MAEVLGYEIKGKAIKGDERILTNQLWKPEQFGVQRSTVYFTNLVKGVSDDAKQSIKRDGGFKGNVKQYGKDLSAAFTWWSVYINDVNAERIRNEAYDRKQEHAEIYDDGSRYGENLFVEKLDDLIKMYEKCIKGPSEIRVLATYVYKREVQHSVVVVPMNDETFKNHQLFARREENGIYRWKLKYIVKPVDDNDHYGNDHDDDDDYSDDGTYVAAYAGDMPFPSKPDTDARNVWVPFPTVNLKNNVWDAAYAGDMQFLSKPDNDARYVWFPFSTVQWDKTARPPKQRHWAHLAFAFYLDPIADKMMRVPEVNNEDKWKECNLQHIDLTAELED